MSMTEITKLIALILSVSIAGERLVAIFKALIPRLAVEPKPGEPADPKADIPRKLILMVIAFFACWFTASIIRGWPPAAWIDLGSTMGKMPTALIGLLASGGSAFWTSILGYTKAISDVKTMQFLHNQLNYQLSLAEFNSRRIEIRTALALRRIRRLAPPKFNGTQHLKFTRI